MYPSPPKNPFATQSDDIPWLSCNHVTFFAFLGTLTHKPGHFKVELLVFSLFFTLPDWSKSFFLIPGPDLSKLVPLATSGII